MNDAYLYSQIARTIREEILRGELKPGDRLPSVREMAEKWGCTIGTVQHAYRELAQQSLVVSRPGQGTKVVEKLPVRDETPLRWIHLIHRAESFLLEVLTAGYSLPEVERAFGHAMDRWRIAEQELAAADEKTLRFAGSHDLVLTWLAGIFPEIAPGYSLQLRFSGSLGGLIALAEGTADIAGSHLWDDESDTYNAPFVRRVLPGKRTALVTLAHRHLGLILPPGNPQAIQGLGDLSRPGIRFVNRQTGSGTRVWLDIALQKAGTPPEAVQGYEHEVMTHSAVAQAVAEGKADVGIGLKAAALNYSLDFILLARDRYDLVIPEAVLSNPAVRSLVDWLKDDRAHKMLEELGGYDANETGQIEWVSG